MKNKIISLLLSFLIAFALWIYVITVVSPNSTDSFTNIPVELVGENILQERGLMVVQNMTPTIDLQIEGNRSDLNKLNRSNISVTVDVTKIDTAGTLKTAYDVRFPGDIPDNALSVQSQSPDNVSLVIEEMVSKEVPVSVTFEGKVPKNYKQKKETLDYPNIPIVGAKSVIDTIVSAEVVVDVDDKTSTFQTDALPFVFCDAKGNKVESSLVKCDINTVRVTVPIVFVKEVPLVLPTIIAGNGASQTNTTFEILPKTVEISGPEKILETVNEFTLIGEINLGDEMFSKGTQHELTFEYVLTPGVINETSEVNEAVVKINTEKVVTESVQVSPNTVDWGVGAKGYSVRCYDMINIEVRGSQERIDQLKSAENPFVIKAVDQNISSSTREITIQIKLDEAFDDIDELYVLTETIPLNVIVIKN